jgi:8-oxo-dGTP pyrophosphatase MutT (NUDIX family)
VSGSTRSPEADDSGRTERLVSSLRNHVPADEAEGLALKHFLEELVRLPRPFDESSDPVHVTVSTVVVGPRGTLLHLHKRLGIWLQPGGHVEAFESPESAALRETQEETGLEVRHPDGGPDLIHVDVHSAARGHIHLDLRYLTFAPDADPRPPAHESQDVRWFSPDEAFSVADESLAAALRAAETRVFIP